MNKNPKISPLFGRYLYTSCDRYKNATEANNNFKVRYGHYKHLSSLRNAIRALLRTLKQFLCILRDLGGVEKSPKFHLFLADTFIPRVIDIRMLQRQTITSKLAMAITNTYLHLETQSEHYCEL